MSKNKKKKKSIIGTIIWWFTILIATAVFLFSAYMLVTIWLEYRQGTEEYDDLRQFVSTSPAEATAIQEEEGEERTPFEPMVDFAALHEVNEDVIGWLYVEALEEIDYPIVQGTDNDYYLHRTVKQTYNFAGSIFLESTNKSNFSEPHNIVFGHNMKNGSMFGQLRQFRDREVYERSPYFWIYTPTANYKYKIFSVQEVRGGGDAYLLFSGPGEAVEEYANGMAKKSEIEVPGIGFTKSSKIVTLSTCTTTDTNRLIIQGIRVD